MGTLLHKKELIAMANSMSVLVTLIIRGVGSAGNLLLLLMITNIFGEAEAGKFVSVLAYSFLLAMFFGLGIQRYILYRFGQAVESSLNFFLPIFKICLLISLLLVFIGLSQTYLGLSRLGMSLAIAGLILPTLVLAEYNICIGKPNLSFLFSTSLAPMIFTCILIALWSAKIPGLNTLAILFFSNLCVLVMAIKFTIRVSSLSIDYREYFNIIAELKCEWKRMFYYWFSSINEILLARIFALLAPLFLDDGAVGRVSIVLSIASFGGTILLVGRAIYGPKIAEISTNISSELDLRETLRQARFTTLSMSLLFFAPVAVMSKKIATLFQVTDVETVSWLIVVTCLFQIARSSFGIAETALSLGKKPWQESLLISGSTASIIAVTWILDPNAEEVWVYTIMTVMLIRSATAYILVHRTAF